MRLSRQDPNEPTIPNAPPGPQRDALTAVPEAWGAALGRYGALRGVVVEDTGSAIRLEGRVPSHYLKQVALAVACQAAGSRPVINRIVVGPPAPRQAHAPASP